MATIKGYLDARNRPRIFLRFTNQISLDFLIDTGFNGELFLGVNTAQSIGTVLQPIWRSAAVAGPGPLVRVQEGVVRLHWSSGLALRSTSVLVFSPETTKHRTEPDGLLGMQLIHPGKLTIDCLNQEVEISI